MIQKLFSICFLPAEDHNLHVEIGRQHIACWCTGDTQNLEAFEYFTYSENDESEDFEKLFSEAKLHSILLNNAFAATQIIWETGFFTCIPNEFFAPDKIDSYTKYAGFKIPFSKSLACTENNFTVAFTVKEDALQTMQQTFPDAPFSHKICLLSKDIKTDAAYTIKSVFYHHHFLLLAFKENALQLATSFQYQSPKDCLYYILNTMQQLNMPVTETVVSVSGFIDVNSALYSDLYQYIPLLQPAEKGMIKNEYPAHYFTPFYKP